MNDSVPKPSGARRILVVEDEVLISLLLETILSDAGYDVVLAESLPDALEIIGKTPFDLAILDLNIKGQKAYPAAEKLAAANIPFIFATGGGGGDLEDFRDRPRIQKPFQEAEILNAIRLLL
jgi:DNA-binding response OmpR family regulator